jgi:hypothetical protein
MTIRFPLILAPSLIFTQAMAMNNSSDDLNNEVRPPISPIQQQLMEEDDDIQEIILKSIEDNRFSLKEKQEFEQALNESLEIYAHEDQNIKIAERLSEQTFLEQQRREEKEFQHSLEMAFEQSIQEYLRQQQKVNIIENLTPVVLAQTIQAETLNVSQHTFENNGYQLTLEMRQKMLISKVFSSPESLIFQALPNGNHNKKEYKITTNQSTATLGILTITKI